METPWIDAWIRWERDSKEVVAEDEDEDEEQGEPLPPTEQFSFSYQLPGNNDDIVLELKGFPSESEQIWNSTGLTLWPCSHYLCEYLLEHHATLLQPPPPSQETCTESSQQPPQQQVVLELGSGLGRCGLLAYHLLLLRNNKTADECHCSTHVYLTDGDTDTLKQLRDNVQHNTKQPANKHTNNDTTTISTNTTISCHQLLWGTETTKEFCQAHKNVILTDDSDNNQGSNNIRLVLGSDLIYVPQVIQPLFETVKVLLSHTHDNDNTAARFLMAHSNRRQGSSVTLEMVLEGATNAGLSHEIVMESPPQEGI
ncbi:family with sequence similarity 86 [Seminavis robusta]|uniref:Family with sequence similarity 86 n=1 Tax=Seminavis robusta TaxID=568900 RepID=A0A9N8DWT2_9STRA|nr:family with sequence similarity 86 [Seminavis robusta]|eukprot:Sro306_g112960.1 family with sequence similarity 86 (312) ;mRNA; f:28910-29845